MGWLTEFVKEYLPTPWSRRVAIVSLTIATALLFLPEWWQRIGLSPTDQPTLMLRLPLIATVLFLGSFIALVLVTRAYNAQTKSHMAEIEAIMNEHKKNAESKAEAERKAEDFMAQQINYDNRGIV